MRQDRLTRMRRRLGRAAALALASMVFVAVFADAIAGDSPFFVVSRRGLHLLPSITLRSHFGEQTTSSQTTNPYSDKYACWPLLRSGPSRKVAEPFVRPSLAHPLGTDAFGRDVLARLVHGTRTTLLLAAAVICVALSIGGTLGTLAAIYGGLLDSVVQRSVEALSVFPAVVLIALLQSFDRNSSLISLGAVLSLVRCAEVAKLSRLLVVRAVEQEWVLAARAMGASVARILLSHIGPTLISPLLSSAAFSLGAVVLTEAALSFLGLGMPIEPASWGEMLGEVRWGARPWVVIPPAVAVAVLVGGAIAVAQGGQKSVGPFGRPMPGQKAD